MRKSACSVLRVSIGDRGYTRLFHGTEYHPSVLAYPFLRNGHPCEECPLCLCPAPEDAQAKNMTKFHISSRPSTVTIVLGFNNGRSVITRMISVRNSSIVYDLQTRYYFSPFTKGFKDFNFSSTKILN